MRVVILKMKRHLPLLAAMTACFIIIILSIQLYKSNLKIKISTRDDIQKLIQKVDDIAINDISSHEENTKLIQSVQADHKKLNFFIGKMYEEVVTNEMKIIKLITDDIISRTREKNKRVYGEKEEKEPVKKINDADWPALNIPFPMCNDPHPESRHILSYSLFGKKAEHLGKFIYDVVNESLLLDPYKDFTFRIYVDKHFSQESRENIRKKLPRVRFCDMQQTPKYGDLSDFIGTIWRFLPMGDNTIDVFCSRDLDSPLIERGADAVKEWLATDKQIHIMRDNEQHGIAIMGGMWCYRVSKNRQLGRNMLDEVIWEAQTALDTTADQTLLFDYVWTKTRYDSLQHDSYHCGLYTDAKPFPTKRKHHYVGCVRDCWVYSPEKCPAECRPKGHTDWKYC